MCAPSDASKPTHASARGLTGRAPPLPQGWHRDEEEESQVRSCRCLASPRRAVQDTHAHAHAQALGSPLPLSVEGLEYIEANLGLPEDKTLGEPARLERAVLAMEALKAQLRREGNGVGVKVDRVKTQAAGDLMRKHMPSEVTEWRKAEAEWCARCGLPPARCWPHALLACRACVGLKSSSSQSAINRASSSRHWPAPHASSRPAARTPAQSCTTFPSTRRTLPAAC